LWLCNKRFGVCNIFTSAIFLEFMEVKKLPVLLGCCMDKYSIPVASGGADDQVLEDFSAAETLAGLDSALVSLKKMVAAPELLPWRSVRDDESTCMGQDDAGS
jgi:hypothetical protein